MRNFPPLRKWRLPRLCGTVSVLRSFTKLIPPGQVTAGSPSKRKSSTPPNVVRVGPPAFALRKSLSTPPTGHRRFQLSVSHGFDLVHGDHRSSFVARWCGSNGAYCCSSRLMRIFCFFNRSDHLVHSPEGRAPWMSSETMSTPVRNTRKPCLRPPCQIEIFLGKKAAMCAYGPAVQPSIDTPQMNGIVPHPKSNKKTSLSGSISNYSQ